MSRISRRFCELHFVRRKELETHAAGCMRVHRRNSCLGQGAVWFSPQDLQSCGKGGQEGQSVTGRKPGKDLVTTHQRPLNRGRWPVSGRFHMGNIHVQVIAGIVGESHGQTGHQARQSRVLVGHVAAGLALAGRGSFPGPFKVFACTAAPCCSVTSLPQCFAMLMSSHLLTLRPSGRLRRRLTSR